MYFSGTYFHNFRNLYPERREWSPGFNLITGPNGSGKTNFLEGLNILSGWGPLEKKAKISNLVKWNSESSSLWGMACGEERSEMFASLRARCQLKSGGKAIGAAEMRGHVPVLSFLPGHMSLLKGGASYRRYLLDMVGALMSVSYAKILRDYRVVLRQKSAMLRRGRDARAADRLLSSLGSWLWTARDEILKMIYTETENFRNLLPAPMDFFFVRGGGGLDEKASDDFRKSLAGARDKEIASRMPLVGPQRDDIKFMCGGIEASCALSRGQSRRAVSAIVLASSLVVERRLGRKPVLIFDEITSELDESGRTSSVEALVGTGCQVFATTTDPMASDGVEIHKMRDGRFL
ncbi:MAG: DNA replication and repair protein RecF [Synergistaceae bacterium]|jgi:DNA replication and repair protein RecF|nr:DNA replication and repair protein RecF [Synergistaceae bacterium]